MAKHIEELNRKMFSSASKFLEGSRSEMDKSYINFISAAIKNKDVTNFLDVGCGLGFLTKITKSLVPNSSATGVDISLELIEIAKRDSEDKYIFKVDDVYDLSFKSDQFDLTICQTLLMHLSQPEKALRQMIRVTKPKGQIIVIEPIIHSDGKNSYVPGKGAVKKIQRDKLHQFDQSQKASGGIDMFIATKLPSIFMQNNLSQIYVTSFNHFTLKTDTISEKLDKVELSSYYEMMISLGYSQSEIEELLKNESLYKSIPGEFNLITLLAVSGIKPNT